MLRINYKISAIVVPLAVVFGTLSCKKDKHPQASIYILDQNSNPVGGISVRFYIKDLDTRKSAIDTTILSDDYGIAHLEVAQEAYLDVAVGYEDKDQNYIQAETIAKLIPNEHFIDTLIIYIPHVY